MTVVVTGARGFIGQNLLIHLAERGHAVIEIGSDSLEGELQGTLGKADLVLTIAPE